MTMRAMIGVLVPMVILASAAQAQEAPVRALVERFEAARVRHDPVALAATLAPRYEEISPVGDVDSREEVLGFYAPVKRKPAPAMTDDEIVVRTTGDMALVTLRKSFTAPGSTTRRAIRVRYVAHRVGRDWLLQSTQYTPIPAPRPS